MAGLGSGLGGLVLTFRGDDAPSDPGPSGGPRLGSGPEDDSDVPSPDRLDSPAPDLRTTWSTLPTPVLRKPAANVDKSKNWDDQYRLSCYISQLKAPDCMQVNRFLSREIIDESVEDKGRALLWRCRGLTQ